MFFGEKDDFLSFFLFSRRGFSLDFFSYSSPYFSYSPSKGLTAPLCSTSHHITFSTIQLYHRFLLLCIILYCTVLLHTATIGL